MAKLASILGLIIASTSFLTSFLMVRATYEIEESIGIGVLQLFTGLGLLVYTRINLLRIAGAEIQTITEKAASDATEIASIRVQADSQASQLKLVTEQAIESKNKISTIEKDLEATIALETAPPDITLELLSHEGNLAYKISSRNGVPINYESRFIKQEDNSIVGGIPLGRSSFVPTRQNRFTIVKTRNTLESLVSHGVIIGKITYCSVFHNKYAHHTNFTATIKFQVNEDLNIQILS